MYHRVAFEAALSLFSLNELIEIELIDTVVIDELKLIEIELIDSIVFDELKLNCSITI